MAEFKPEFSPGDILTGAEYDPRKNILHPFIQEMLAYSGDQNAARTTGAEGTAGLSQTPQDANQALTRAYSIAAIQSALLGLTYSWPSKSDIPLPDVLTGLDVTYNVNMGDGSTTHPVSQQGATFVGGGSISINPRSHAQASAAIIPDVQPLISTVWSRELDTMNYAFYVVGNATMLQVLALVTQIINPAKTTVTITIASPGVVTWSGNTLANGNTVMFTTTGTLPTGITANTIYFVVGLSGSTFNVALTKDGSAINTSGSQTGVHSAVSAVRPLPVFQTVYWTITMFGQQVSISADADSIATYSYNNGNSAASYAWGNGNSQESGVTVRTLRIGPVINAAITGYSSTQSETVTATVTANTLAIDFNGSTVVNAITNAPTATSTTITATVAPDSLSATPVAAIPTSGLYLTECNANIDDYGTLQIHAAVIDFSIFA
jgi:hypothetical protein